LDQKAQQLINCSSETKVQLGMLKIIVWCVEIFPKGFCFQLQNLMTDYNLPHPAHRTLFAYQNWAVKCIRSDLQETKIHHTKKKTLEFL
jgi:hypothetical protein